MKTLQKPFAVLILAIMASGCQWRPDRLVSALKEALWTATPISVAERPPRLATALASAPYVPLETPEPTPTPMTFGRMKGGDSLGHRTLVFDTPDGRVEIALVGYGSLMLNFNETIIHINPWLDVADYAELPKADQIWVTDSRPEHLDLKAIRSISTESTSLVVDPGSARMIQELLDFTTIPLGHAQVLDSVQLEAVPANNAGKWKDPEGRSDGVGYVATFGGLRIYIAGDTVQIPEISQLGTIDVALLPIDGVFSMSVEEAAEAAERFNPKTLVPYQVGEGAPSEVASLLQNSDIVVWPFNQPGHPGSEGSPLTSALPQIPAGLQRDDPRSVTSGQRSSTQLLLPDLRTLPPFDLRIRWDSRTNTTLLRFSNSIWNSGQGPIELLGISDPASGRTYVTQRIFASGEAIHELVVGEFTYHPHHFHWHFEGFALFELWSLASDGTLDAVVSSSGKASYCVRDYSRSSQPQVQPRPRYTVCGTDLQGISPGWIDTYQYFLEGQSLDISSLPDGRYALISTADPFNLIHESDDTNNMAVIYLQIRDRRVTVIERPNAVEVEPDPSGNQ